jgi:hypothetical protein
MIEINQVYQKSTDMVYREIVGEGVLVPIRRSVGDFESIFTLNETAARIWSLVDGQRSLAEICQELTREFEIGPAEAEADILELASQLEQIGAIHPAELTTAA